MKELGEIEEEDEGGVEVLVKLKKAVKTAE